MQKKTLYIALLMALVFTLVFSTVAFAEGITYTENWDGKRGTDSEKCEYAGQPGRPATGWIHWVFSTKGESTNAELILGGTGSGTYYPGEPLNAEVWHFYTPFFPLNGLTATINLFGGEPGNGSGLVISDYCPGVQEKLEVSKTVVTTYEREHFWDIEKSVTPSDLYLYIPGQGAGKPSSGTAVWEVKVTYGGFVDYGFNISGDIKVKNTGLIDAVVTSVTDVLAGDPIGISCPVTFPYTLPAGESFTCTYSEDFTDFVEGNNVALVETEKATYTDTKAIKWGDPAKEINKIVTIKDSMFGSLGTVTAPNSKTFSYTETYNWEDFGANQCGDHIIDNTATIVETGQSALASLWVHVQCYKYETAYGKGNSATCFIPTFSNWGWTNSLPEFGSYTFELWAAAGQCNTSKGTLVGSVTVNYSGLVSYSYNMAAPYTLKETHFYAGKTMFPKVGNKFTVAPGQYTNKGPFTGSIYVIAHAVVGLPDPTFGPK